MRKKTALPVKPEEPYTFLFYFTLLVSKPR
jgi:hypothetical protein